MYINEYNNNNAWSSFSFRTTTDSSSVCNMFLWSASSQLKRRTDDKSYNSIQLFFCIMLLPYLLGWARDDGSSIAVWPRPRKGGRSMTTKKTEPTELNVFWKQKGRFRAAALKTLVIDHCETGASMQVGLVSRSCPHPPPKKKNSAPVTPTTTPWLATTYSSPYQVPTYSQLPSFTLLLVVTALLATYLPQYLW
jgi:hypothetical protein